MAPNANKSSRFYLLRFYLLIAVLLTSCGYPLRTPPFLNGQLTGMFCPEDEGDQACYYVGAPPSEDTLPAILDVRVESWSATEYTFSGTLEMDGMSYTVSGKEEGGWFGQHEYLAPQAHLLGGEVTAVLTNEEGANYRLEGYVRYGIGGGPSPEREEPSATFTIFLPEIAPCEGDTHCVLGRLIFSGD